ncbi:hypothetical protein GTP45_25880 [Pseudoduganella sp. FT55W]|uniref:Uncharacterized protein n=1 Tax=Duganella rivi TaxID=2666083 RepID=A0A7X4KEA3_9BURK|nr:hypothetical protein [Duganella rivi]MYM70209.1 hypothetical protein [Duganella rivi]
MSKYLESARMLRPRKLDSFLLFLVWWFQAAAAAAVDPVYYAVQHDPTAAEMNAACMVFRQTGGEAHRAGFVKESRQWQCIGKSSAFEVEAKMLCPPGILLSRDVKAVTVDHADGSVSLRCMAAQISLACVTPTASVPDWPQPSFASARDDHCDMWSRGAAPTLASSMPAVGDSNGFESVSAMLQPILEFTAPDLMRLQVRNLITDASGKYVRVPATPLRRVMDGRPAIAVEWRSNCAACENLLDNLHKGMRSFRPTATDHHDTQLVILFRHQDDASALRDLQMLRARYPGRAVWAVEGLEAYPPVGYDAPGIWLFDRHGLLRAMTSGSKIKPDTEAWGLLEQPYILMDVALRDPVWRNPPKQIPFSVLAQRTREGRQLADAGEAPDEIILPSEMVDSIHAITEKSVRENREYSSWLVADPSRERLLPMTKGLEKRASRNLIQLDAAIRAAPANQPLSPLGTFHTHPMNSWFSHADIRYSNTSLNLLGVAGGTIVLAVPTYERFKSYPAVNPQLAGQRSFEWMQRSVEASFFNSGRTIALADEFLPAPLLAWKRAAPGNPFMQPTFAMLEMATTQGTLIYAGTGTKLTRVALPLREPRSWTGNKGSTLPGEEAGLSSAERLAITMLLRALQGEKDAFCKVRTEDIAKTFPPHVRNMIRNLPAIQARLNPLGKPLSHVASGFFNDADLLATVDMAENLIEMSDGRMRLRDHPVCMMTWTRTIEKELAGEPDALAVGYAVNIYDDGGSARSFVPDKARFAQQIYFLATAKAFGCANVVVRTYENNALTGHQCDAPLKPP